MSVRIEQILEVLEGIHGDYPDGRLRISEIRLNAVTAVARIRGVRRRTVSDKFRRQLAPDVKLIDEFDGLVEKWLNGGTSQLQRVLERHAIDNHDPKRISDFFAQHPTP